MSVQWQLVVGIPTIHSSRYIYHSLSSMAKEISRLPSTFQTTMVVCLNGTLDGGATAREIGRFISEQPGLKVVLLELQEGGKNLALNHIVRYAKEEASDLLHFFDDDIDLKEGSLLINLTTLIEQEAKLGIPVLVGSNFIGTARPWRELLSEQGNLFSALNSWVLQQVFLLPFQPHTDKPRFCLGGSLGAFTRDFPYYPDDDTGIADDGFIGNYYALIGKELYEKTGVSSIIKPQGSEFYFQVATSYQEWLKQQVRIFVGVYYSYLYFEEHIPFFERYFAWEFSIGQAMRRPGSKPKGLKHYLLRFLLRRLQAKVLTKSLKIIESRSIPEWAVAESTKNAPLPPAAGSSNHEVHIS